jgi:hypothetical protein
LYNHIVLHFYFLRTQLYTNGTLIDPDMNEDNDVSFLACIIEKKIISENSQSLHSSSLYNDDDKNKNPFILSSSSSSTSASIMSPKSSSSSSITSHIGICFLDASLSTIYGIFFLFK